ncbi:MAG: GGDEF domain-containing protein, partial [Bacillota bacterium]
RDHNKKIGCVYFIHDITEQKETLLELSFMAAFDSLTGLYNRRKLMEDAIMELENARSLGHCISALMIDIDHFKVINDQYGHLAGDEVLKKIGEICKEKMDDIGIIGRYGGEEFLALLPGVSMNQAFGVAEEIRNEIAAAGISYGGKTLQTTVSIGLDTEIEIPDEFSLDQLISKADQALYEAKAKGRNRVFSE